MRTREEIENAVKSYRGTAGGMIAIQTEVLLDIRDLLAEDIKEI